jgi:putative ABC transport system permease protein
MALLGGIAGAVLSFPAGKVFQRELETFLPIFEIEGSTIVLMLVASVSIGFMAALPPAVRACRMGIAEGLRHIG